MALCPECGNPVDDTDNYCASCGNRLRTDQGSPDDKDQPARADAEYTMDTLTRLMGVFLAHLPEILADTARSHDLPTPGPRLKKRLLIVIVTALILFAGWKAALFFHTPVTPESAVTITSQQWNTVRHTTVPGTPQGDVNITFTAAPDANRTELQIKQPITDTYQLRSGQSVHIVLKDVRAGEKISYRYIELDKDAQEATDRVADAPAPSFTTAFREGELTYPAGEDAHTDTRAIRFVNTANRSTQFTAFITNSTVEETTVAPGESQSFTVTVDSVLDRDNYTFSLGPGEEAQLVLDLTVSRRTAEPQESSVAVPLGLYTGGRMVIARQNLTVTPG
jgi:hypothetical protein